MEVVLARFLGPDASTRGGKGEKAAERPAVWIGIEIGDDIISLVGEAK